jgi:hypothetical protein
MSNPTIKVEGSKLVIECEMDGKGVTKSLKSIMLAGSAGYQPTGVPGVSFSLNVIRDVTDAEIVQGSTPDMLTSEIDALATKGGKGNAAHRGRLVRLLDQMQKLHGKPVSDAPKAAAVVTGASIVGANGSGAKPASVRI